jgi:thiosulfate reductase cytochrome b subunit
MQQVSPKRWHLSTKLHGFACKKTILFKGTDVRIVTRSSMFEFELRVLRIATVVEYVHFKQVKSVHVVVLWAFFINRIAYLVGTTVSE